MRANIWICAEYGNKKYLRPMNHANCESYWHTIYEIEAKKKMVIAPDYCEVGKCYDLDKINNNSNN